MKVALELETIVECIEEDVITSDSLKSSKTSLKTPLSLNTFKIEAIGGNGEDTDSYLLDMVSRHCLDVILEFSGEVGTLNQRLKKLTLKSRLFTEFEEKFCTNFTLGGQMRLCYKVPGEQYEKMINFDTNGFEEFQDGDTYTFLAVKYGLNLVVPDPHDNVQKAPLSTIITLWISTPDPDKFAITRKILNDGIVTDVTIVASNDAKINCHKSFLIAHSTMFKTMLTSGMKEEKTNVIEMKTVSEPVVKSLLAYLYSWDLTEASKNCEIAIELLKVADCYIIPRLNRDISNMLFNKQADWFNVDGALELFLLANRLGRAHLKVTALRALQMKFDELKTNRGYLELFKKDPTTGMELCNAALSMKPVAKNDNNARKHKHN